MVTPGQREAPEPQPNRARVLELANWMWMNSHPNSQPLPGQCGMHRARYERIAEIALRDAAAPPVAAVPEEPPEPPEKLAFEAIADGICPDPSDSATTHSTCLRAAEKALAALKVAGYQVVKESDYRERDAAVSALTKVRELCEYEDGTLTAVHLVEAVLAALPPVDSPEEPHRKVELARDRAVCAADGLPWPCKEAESG